LRLASDSVGSSNLIDARSEGAIIAGPLGGRRRGKTLYEHFAARSMFS